MPIDRPSTRGYVLLPLAAPHHRREGLIHARPSTGAGKAKPSPGGGRGNNQDEAPMSSMKGRLVSRGWLTVVDVRAVLREVRWP